MIVLVTVGAALAGCGGSDGDTALPAGPASSATSAAPTTSAAPGADDQVLTAYLHFWDAVVTAHKASNPTLPALAAAAANPELARVRKAVALNVQQKLSLRGTVSHSPKVTTVAGTTATVEDCYDLSAWNPVDVRTNQPIEVTEAGGTGRYHARYTLRRTTGAWIVTDQASLGSC